MRHRFLRWHWPLLLLLNLGARDRVFSAGLVNSYAWIQTEKLRGAYLAATNPRSSCERIKKIGVNCLIVKFYLQSNPNDSEIQSLRAWSQACKTNSLHFFVSFDFRGGETEKISGSRREVTAAGLRLDKTPCPLDEQFWGKYVTERLAALSEMSTQFAIDGVVLDMEMYGADHSGYSDVCYCDDCFKEFSHEAGARIVAGWPAARERAAWIKAHGLEDRFRERFRQRVLQFAGEGRKLAHRRNDQFILGAFWLDDPGPFMSGVAAGLGEKRRPALCFSEYTFSRGLTPFVEAKVKEFKGPKVYALVIPGLWIHQIPTQNLAEQCYYSARTAAGYWAYTFESLVNDLSKLPGYALPEPSERYWDALAQANKEIDAFNSAGNAYHSALLLRPFKPSLQPVVPQKRPEEDLAVVPASLAKANVAPQLPRLRYRNTLSLLVSKGRPAVVKITSYQLGKNYEDGVTFGIFDRAGNQVLSGAVELGGTTNLTWTPDQDGPQFLITESHRNSYFVTPSSLEPFAWTCSTQQPVRVHGILGKLYFLVPRGVSRFEVNLQSSGQGTNDPEDITILTPDGTVAAKAAGDFTLTRTLAIDVPDTFQGRIWSLAGSKLSNDLKVFFSGKDLAYVGTDPARLLGSVEGARKAFAQ